MSADEMFHIQRIKDNKDQRGIEESIDYLIEQHSGIYFDMARKFLPPNADFRMDQQDVKDEMPTFFWEAANAFDPDKGCKFSSRLGDLAKWKFLDSGNKYSEPIINVPQDDKFWERFENEHDSSLIPVDDSNIDLALSKVNELNSELVTKIFTLRYKVGKNSKVMPWKDIGREVGRTHENCRQIHAAALETIRKKIEEENS